MDAPSCGPVPGEGQKANEEENRRVRLSAGTTTELNLLRDLARDASVTVRAALAMNPAAPAEADRLLAGDHDENVRLLLAHKIAALLPGLSQAEHSRLFVQTWETLALLIKDEVTQIRAIIAEAVKGLPDVPHELVLCLARDTEVPVYQPVILFSPLLTTDDLIALITDPPCNGTMTAVAERRELASTVSDAIAASTNAVAIRALLANPTAQIRETTLDALVARSVNHPEWHEPLVGRPCLPPHAARLLSGIVAAHLLEILAARADLPKSLTEELRVRVAAQLALQHGRAPPDDELSTGEALSRARALAESAELNEDALLEAARRGEARYATTLLAVAAGTSVSVADRAALLRSAKGIVSLVWKAGFTMRAAVAMQFLLARLPPSSVLMPGPGGTFPLAIEEMRWQLDFLARMER
jgi:uncharacterized protein (DUF2336 family)